MEIVVVYFLGPGAIVTITIAIESWQIAKPNLNFLWAFSISPVVVFYAQYAIFTNLAI
jgi:hypothetical protein